jgi:hypothetical protein
MSRPNLGVETIRGLFVRAGGVVSFSAPARGGGGFLFGGGGRGGSVSWPARGGRAVVRSVFGGVFWGSVRICFGVRLFGRFRRFSGSGGGFRSVRRGGRGSVFGFFVFVRGGGGFVSAGFRVGGAVVRGSGSFCFDGGAVGAGFRSRGFRWFCSGRVFFAARGFGVRGRPLKLSERALTQRGGARAARPERNERRGARRQPEWCWASRQR